MTGNKFTTIHPYPTLLPSMTSEPLSAWRCAPSGLGGAGERRFPGLVCNGPDPFSISQWSTVPEGAEVPFQEYRKALSAQTMRRQHAVAKLLRQPDGKSPAVCFCCEAPLFGKESEEVGVGYSGRTGRVRFHGLQQCGSVNICPHCAVKAAKDRTFVADVVLKACKARGITAVFVTATVGRDRYEPLEQIAKDLFEGWQGLRRGRPALTFIKHHGIIGFIDFPEYGHNDLTGHHPHMHCLLLCEGDEAEALAAANMLLDSFVVSVRQRNRKIDRGAQDCAIVTSSEDLARYVAKGAAFEAAGGHMKKLHGEGTRGPFELVDAFDSDPFAKTRFREFSKCFKGRRSGYVSPTILKRLGLSRGDLVRPDESSSEDEGDKSDFVQLGTIAQDVWKRLCARGHRADLAYHVEVGTPWATIEKFVEHWGRPFPPWEEGTRQEYAKREHDWSRPPPKGGKPRQLRKRWRGDGGPV